MNDSQKLPKVSLQVPPLMWNQFSQSMLQARSTNEEVIGFLFCQRQQISKRQVRYLPKTWVVPAPDCYEHQSATGLVLKQEFHLYLLETYLSQGLDVVHIHTHAGNHSPDFSGLDDRYEAEYALFLSSNFRKPPRLISGVFDEYLQHSQFRIWNKKGNSCEEVKFYRSWFELEETQNPLTETDLMFARQKGFGQTFQKQLGQLTVTLIGCGGIGAILAEQLGRLGVKNWLLIDPDRLEPVNLNRMPGATWKMADQGWHKVEYVKQLIKRIYQTGSCVKAIPESIENETVQKEIAATDLIVVATDNHRSRQIAQELALQYARPLVCLGTHIDIKSDGSPRMYCRITVPPLGGGWCLMCGNIINLQRAALESAPVEIESLAARAGYLEGINDPAVFWLNGICASTGVGVIQGMVTGFLNLEEGLDWIYQFPQCKWHHTNTDYLATPDCYFCGAGDRDFT
ncbi:HesA/MoeB/ThiF family protein [Argonema antarcticum]|uniref:HesA/MoeB/ThiF family protein n=1 Tax=Argonema antarcticum TaxID=2942763 RepID=UPI002012D7F7|nr:ThiF family adenylyltransferase [Argonema antarcticum]MCL1475854.1 ThiF family adenylyltransferase [Argonema antarcticum A004/B2]